MKKYKWILFDADNTLFHFNACQGLQNTFLQLGVTFTNKDYHAYEEINQPLWKQYQDGAITAHDLQNMRFNQWSEKLNIPAIELNNAFLQAMIALSSPLEGAISLLNTLQGKTKLGIITNGFNETFQQSRLERAGLKAHFDLFVMSEKVGVAKPHPDIFEHALLEMGSPDRRDVLMVGDNLESDILGGLNVGLQTCWLNVEKKATYAKIVPHYQVASLKDLEMLLLQHL